MDEVEVIVGRVGRGHGLGGEVTVALATSEPETRFAPGSRLITEDGRVLTVERTRRHGGSLLVGFAGVADRTAADELRGAVLLAAVPADLTPVDPEEFYDRQLVGLTVRTREGRTIGTVVAVEHPPAQDLLVVRVGDATRYVPFVAELVPDVDLAAGTCTVVDLPGLLDDAAVEAR
ncbi:ribosome maturation factor RimM [Propionicicella superfundia]|uniref:ribosome maturation factor RimM n=1 Tax=Propionicicella superfundia TaxID=348582 RepID=UPI0004137E67